MPVLTVSPGKDSEPYARRAACTRDHVAQLRRRLAQVAEGGGEQQRARHAKRGKLFVRERVELLVDPGTALLELSPLAAWDMYGGDVPSAGIVSAIGHVNGQPCVIMANDATVKGGTYFPVSVRKHLRAQQVALESRLPCIYLVDSGGAHLPLQHQMFADRQHGGRFFYNQAQMSAAGIAQVACVMGSCTAGGAYVPAMSDETIIVEKTGTVFLAGPPLVKAATGELVSAEELGGAQVHTRISGLADHLARDDAHALSIIRDIVEHVPRATARQPWERRVAMDPLAGRELLDGLAPSGVEDTAPIDLHAILACILDGSELHEFKATHGMSVTCGMAHLHGYPVGVLGRTAGPLTSEGASKAAHFVELCSQRRVPLVVFQHAGGDPADPAADVLRAAARLASVLACTNIPVVEVVVGTPRGADAWAMSVAGARLTWMWPGASRIDPDGVSPTGIDAWSSTAQGFDDGIIEPAQTREVLALSLAAITTNAPVGATAHGVVRM